MGGERFIISAPLLGEAGYLTFVPQFYHLKNGRDVVHRDVLNDIICAMCSARDDRQYFGILTNYSCCT